MAKIKYILFALIFTGIAHADTYVNIYGISYHTDRSAGFNEDNVGWGVRYVTDAHNYIEIGRFVDSMRTNAEFVALGHEFSLNKYLSFAVMGGALDQKYSLLKIPNGYIERQKKTILVAMPLVMIKTPKLTINFSYFPNWERQSLYETYIVYFSFPIR